MADSYLSSAQGFPGQHGLADLVWAMLISRLGSSLGMFHTKSPGLRVKKQTYVRHILPTVDDRNLRSNRLCKQIRTQATASPSGRTKACGQAPKQETKYSHLPTSWMGSVIPFLEVRNREVRDIYQR